MNKPVSMVEVVLVRPSLGIIARGPVLAAKGREAVGALLGPLESQPGDRIALIASGREPQVWSVEDNFSLGTSHGTFPQCALLHCRLDSAEDWDVTGSLLKFRHRKLDYEAGASMPTVRIVLN